jgi:D-lyxose ketol-isomerase
MKRSEINRAIAEAIEALRQNRMALPPFAAWTPEDWRRAGPDCARVKANGLGWDVTDFGLGDFDHAGAVLFTLRNGNHAQPELGTPYAEKVIVLKPGQYLPLHFHWTKTEDIINRGGGTLVVELYGAHADETPDKTSPVTVFCDGCQRTLQAGEPLRLAPGESITLIPRLYHRLSAAPDDGTLICGEVSSINDDRVDNRFAEPVSRFSTIEEDEPPLRLLCNEYPA